MKKLSDLVVVVTGASSGIGAVLADQLVARGAKIVIAARREAELGALVAKLGEANALSIVADVSTRADNDRIRNAALAKFGRVDAWVANAGRGISRSILEITDADMSEMIDTNVRSVIYGMQAIVPHFKERGDGHFVLVSSMLGRIPFAPIRSAYSASKAAATSLVTTLRLELRATHPNIQATTVFPGVVATEFGKNAVHAAAGPDSRQIPGAQPVDEVAKVIADVLESRKPEVYTRPEALAMMGRYFGADDVTDIESKFARPPT